MLAEITAATRLVIVCNPNNPTSTALPLAEIAAFVRATSRATSRVILDEAYCEFNLLQDPDASLDLLAQHPNLVLLRTFSKVYGLVRPARRLRAVRLGGLPHRRRPGAPAVLLQRRRAGGRDRGAAPPGRDRAPRRAQPSPSASALEDGLRGLGHRARASRRPTSSGSTCRRPTAERDVVKRPGRAQRARARRRRRWAARARCASRSGPADENQQFLAALGDVLAA